MVVRVRLQSVLAGILSLGLAGATQGADTFWNVPGTGDWNVAGNWSGALIPTAADSVFVTHPAALETVEISGVAAAAASLEIGANGDPAVLDRVVIGNNTTLTLHGGGLVNAGVLALESTGHNTNLIFDGPQTLSGTGSLMLGDRATNRIVSDAVITQASGHSILGAGQLLVNLGGLVNETGASVVALGSNLLTIDPSNALGVTNFGTLAGEGSGGLTLFGGTFTNAGAGGSGVIEARGGSTARIIASNILGGTVRSLGSGLVTAMSSTFDAVTVEGNLDTPNNTTNTFLNGLTLNGTITVSSTGHNSNLSFSGSQSVDGNGEIVMSDRTTNRLLSDNNTLTVGAGITVRGAGQVMANTGGLINHGIIRAEGANTLTVDVNDLGFQNLGQLIAAGTGGLRLQNSTFDLGATSIDVLAGSHLMLQGATLLGGTLNVDPGATANVHSSIFDGVSVEGDISQSNNSGTTVRNGLTVNGTWNLLSTGHNTDVTFQGEQTLSGNGTIAMSDRTTNRLLSDNNTLTIGPGITLRGAGQALANTGGLLNLGTIRAEGASTLTLDVNQLGMQNQGQLFAAGSGGLRLQSSTFDLGATAIDVLAGSKLLLQSATLLGGTINVDAAASANVLASTLDGVTVVGDIDQTNNTTTTIKNALTLNGTWNLRSTGHNTNVHFEGNQTLGGNGTIAMSDRTTNRLLTDNSIVTFGPDITIRGAGQIGANTGGFINQGRLQAEGANTLTIDANDLGFTNLGTLESVGTGGLVLLNTVFDFGGTALDVLAGSKIQVTGSVVRDAVFNVDPTAVANARSSVFDNLFVTSGARVEQSNNTLNTFINDARIDGSWHLDSTGHNTSMMFDGDQTISGTGEIVFSDRTTNRIIGTGASNSLVTFGADLTVRGAGQLMANSGGLVNDGSIIADGTQAMVIDVNDRGFTNHGTLAAAGTGGLVISASEAHLGNTSIDVGADSKLAINSSVIHGGRLAIAPSASVNATASFSTFDSTVIDGTLTQANNTTNTFVGGVRIDGAWVLGSQGNSTDIFASGEQTIAGEGEIRFGDSSANRLRGNDNVITIGGDLTLRGAGQVLVNSAGMVNQGTLHADSDVGAMVVDPNALGFVNQGLLLADGNAGMSFVGGFVQTAGHTRANSTLTLTGSAEIQGGILDGTGTIVGDVNVTGGTLNPGNSPGLLTIDGAYSQSGQGLFLVEIAGASDFDQLQVTETATLGGTIDVELLGYVPTVGQTFDVLMASFISGNFDNSTIDTGSATFAVDIIADQVVQLTVVSAVPLPPAVWMLGSTVVVLAGVRRLRAKGRARAAS